MPTNELITLFGMLASIATLASFIGGFFDRIRVRKYIVLAVSAVLFMFFFLYRYNEVETEFLNLGPYFFSKSESERSKEGFVLVSKSNIPVITEELPDNFTRTKLLNIRVTGGLWSRVDEVALFKVTVFDKSGCYATGNIRIDRQISQNNSQNYRDSKLMTETQTALKWNCSMRPSKVEIQVSPGSWAVSVNSIIISIIYDNSILSFVGNILTGHRN